jgi:hypothetical protein
MINSIENLDNALIVTLQGEADSLFEQGDVMIEAIVSGMDEREVYGRYAYLSRRSRRTAELRRKISTIFTPDCRNPELDYYMHVTCAEAADFRKPETYLTARHWLNIAADGFRTPDGKQHPHSIRTLKAQMKAAGLQPAKAGAVFLLSREECTLVKVLGYYGGRTQVVLEIDGEFPSEVELPLENVMVTLTQRG